MKAQDQKFYSIGEVSEICKISKKALRFYDQIGMISPDKISDENHYRLYTRKTLLSVPIIKYYKQMGFKLEEMREFLDGNTYEACERGFRNKIEELKEQQQQIFMAHTSVKDWYDLVREAMSVIENQVDVVTVKYVDPMDYCCMAQDFHYDFMDSIINIEWTNFIEEIGNAITGPVMICFPSFEERKSGKCKQVQVMQKTILACPENVVMRFGGFMAAACYHIGPHETMGETYEKICKWANEYGYRCAKESYERYVTDYWTTRDSDRFVTEVIVQIAKINSVRDAKKQSKIT